ncbi:MAG: DinB family protein [Sinomicrobium sp.]|nr:DinB family protein [Sinomicrobium sp.]
MKKIILPIVMLALVSFTGADTTLTKSERKLAIKEMTNSRNHLLKLVKGLSEKQLNFKSSPERWSIAECVEHIAISENLIFGMLEAALKTPADPSGRPEVKTPDDALLARIKDRSTKVKTFEPFEPSGKYGSFEATLKEFKAKRDEHIRYVKKNRDDLRNRYQKLPFGTIDGFQVLLFMSAHSERHVKQIEEVMADANFPKE